MPHQFPQIHTELLTLTPLGHDSSVFGQSVIVGGSESGGTGEYDASPTSDLEAFERSLGPDEIKSFEELYALADLTLIENAKALQPVGPLGRVFGLRTSAS